MASLNRICVVGTHGDPKQGPLSELANLKRSLERLKRIQEHGSRRSSQSRTDDFDDRERARHILKEMEYLDDYFKGFEPLDPMKSINVIDYLHARASGNNRLQRISFRPEHGTRHLVVKELLHEMEQGLPGFNKAFCSQWLTDRQVILGTKCNNLVVLDVLTGRFVNIPCLPSSPKTNPAITPCGIHAIDLNPSRRLIATGGENANDVAIYKAPSLDPACVGERAHTDYIFDMKWLDDEFLVTGSRDSTISLWRVQEDKLPQRSSTSKCPDKYPPTIRALAVRKVANADKIRALLYNNQSLEIVVLSLNARLHLFDAQTFKQTASIKLANQNENVCLAQSHEYGIYAVGSKNNVFLHDSRGLELTLKIAPKNHYCGTRSLSFSKELLTIGTGNGNILFYDVRNHQFLLDNSKNEAKLVASKGFVREDESYFDAYYNIDYSPAIYTHCYDSSGTKIFSAGGPLPASLSGSYAAIWS